MVTVQENRAHVNPIWEGRFLEIQKEGKWEFVQRKTPGGVLAIIAVTGKDVLLTDKEFANVARRILSEKQEIYLNAPLISRDKISGMLIGAVLGDALGAAVECLSQREIKQNFGRITGFVKPLKEDHHGIAEGAYSDDSQLMLCTLEAIIEANGFDMQKIAAFHVKAKNESTAGWGASTEEAVARLEAGVPWQHSGETIIPNRGVGNGVAMKVPALAALLAESTVDEGTFLSIITAFSQMTHANNLAVASGMVQSKALIYCLNHTPEDFDRKDFSALTIKAAEDSKQAIPLSRSAETLIKRLSLLDRATTMNDEDIVAACDGGDSYIPNSIPQTLLFFLRNYQNVLPLFDAVNAGGDTDTNASMAGALLGALHGTGIFPAELLAKVKDIDSIREAANRFCDKFGID